MNNDNDKPAFCGGCGCETFRIKLARIGDGAERLVVTCTSCESDSVVEPAKPTMVILWGAEATGRLTS